jgi:NAD dependent epimerase/dehydratase family enzyme
MEDFLRAVDFVIADPFLDGAVNLTAPTFPENQELMETFRTAAGMPIGLPAAEWMLELGARLLGTETELILKSRWAMPLRLRDAGFRWRYPEIGPAASDLLPRHGLEKFFRSGDRTSIGARGWIPATTR